MTNKASGFRLTRLKRWPAGVFLGKALPLVERIVAYRMRLDN